MSIERVAVIGAGVMGSAIAAQIANGGTEVLLLDIVPEGATSRNTLAEEAMARMAKADPAPFMDKSAMKRVRLGNLEDDLDELAACDWIIEAVVERLDVKRALYARIDGVRRAGSIVSSNTSTLSLARLIDGQSTAWQRDFLISHFFNPPRYMRLLEVVAGPSTRDDALNAVRSFADHRLGKTVVQCKDTPGFIANRIGIFWMQMAFNEAVAMELPIEEADAVIGRPFGIPKTGMFGLADLVGLDLLPYVARSLHDALDDRDPFQAIYRDQPRLRAMIEAGYTGRKGKGGFYRLNREGGGKTKEAIDLATGAYRPAVTPELDVLKAAASQGPAALLDSDHRAAVYARKVMGATLAYAASLVPEISDDIEAVDSAMRLGYNWKHGPFELIDKIGVVALTKVLETAGQPVPPLLAQAEAQGFYRLCDGRRQVLTPEGSYRDITRPAGVLLLADLKNCTKPLKKNGSAALWDIGDGVVCLEFTGKGNSIDQDVLRLVEQAVDIVQDGYRALVIYNEGSHFSVGANLGLALFAANVAAFDVIENLVEQGQKAYRALKYAPFPVVAAPSGMALGGGCEICLNADAVQAHAESYLGLVEAGVGVIPAWTGTTELLTRWLSEKRRPGGPMPAISQTFETIGMAKVAKSAFEAKALKLLRAEDGITMNRDRLLFDAKAKALSLVDGYQPPKPIETIRLPGETARLALELALRNLELAGKATSHDGVVARELAGVLAGGDTDLTDSVAEADLLALERAAFMRLIKTPGTLARVEHMLETGKPLRN